MAKQTVKTKKLDGREYTALVRLTDDKTGRVFEPGDLVKTGDFPHVVLTNWLTKDPPAVKVRD